MKKREKRNWNRHHNKYSCVARILLFCFWFFFPFTDKQSRRRCSTVSMIEQEPTAEYQMFENVWESVMFETVFAGHFLQIDFLQKHTTEPIQWLKIETETNNIVKKFIDSNSLEYCFRKSSKSHISNRITDSKSTWFSRTAQITLNFLQFTNAEHWTLNAEHIKSKNALVLVIEKMKFLKQNR